MHNRPTVCPAQQEAADRGVTKSLPWCGRPSATSRDIWLIVTAATILRVALHLTYAPWLNYDSNEYLAAAGPLVTGHFEQFDGVRTPGYPLFLGVMEWLAGSDVSEPLSERAAFAITMVQVIGGVISTVLFYLTMVCMGIRRAVALAATLFFACVATFAVFEMGIMSDSLSVFFIVLLFDLLVATIARINAGRPFRRMAALTGLVGGISALVRLNNLVFIVVFIGCIAAFSVLHWFMKHRASAQALARFCLMLGLGVSIPVSGCLVFTHHYTGLWTLTTRSSLVMALTAYNLFDRVEPKDKVLGGMVQNDYDYSKINTDNHIERRYILSAMSNLLARAGQMPIPPHDPHLKRAYLELYIGDVATRLLLKNPDVWLSNGMANVADTFTFNVINIPDTPTRAYHPVSGHSVVISPSGQRWLDGVSAAEQWPLLGCYLMTYATIIVAGIRSLRASSGSNPLDAMVPCALATAAIVTMVSSCFFGLYVPRYGISYYSLFIASTAWLCTQRKRKPAR